MKIPSVIATITILAAAGSAMAGDVAEYVDHSGFVSTKTRAEVRAEYEQARAQGLLNRSEYVTFDTPDIGARGPAGARPSVAGKTRAQVRAELEQARAQDLLNQKEYTGQ